MIASATPKMKDIVVPVFYEQVRATELDDRMRTQCPTAFRDGCGDY